MNPQDRLEYLAQYIELSPVYYPNEELEILFQEAYFPENLLGFSALLDDDWTFSQLGADLFLERLLECAEILYFKLAILFKLNPWWGKLLFLTEYAYGDSLRPQEKKRLSSLMKLYLDDLDDYQFYASSLESDLIATCPITQTPLDTALTDYGCADELEHWDSVLEDANFAWVFLDEYDMKKFFLLLEGYYYFEQDLQERIEIISDRFLCQYDFSWGYIGERLLQTLRKIETIGYHLHCYLIRCVLPQSPKT